MQAIGQPAIVGNEPWLSFDNLAGPWQLHNRVDDPACADARRHLAGQLTEHLHRTQDPFLDTAGMIGHLDLHDAWCARGTVANP